MRGVVLAVLLLCGCGMGNGYEFVDTHNPDSMLAASYVMNRCNDLSIDAKVLFTENERLVPGSLYGLPGEVRAAAWALVAKRRIAVYTGPHRSPDLYTPRYLDFIAKHECCHLSEGVTEDPDETEAMANRCVAQNWKE